MMKVGNYNIVVTVVVYVTIIVQTFLIFKSLKINNNHNCINVNREKNLKII